MNIFGNFVMPVLFPVGAFLLAAAFKKMLNELQENQMREIEESRTEERDLIKKQYKFLSLTVDVTFISIALASVISLIWNIIKY